MSLAFGHKQWAQASNSNKDEYFVENLNENKNHIILFKQNVVLPVTIHFLLTLYSLLKLVTTKTRNTRLRLVLIIQTEIPLNIIFQIILRVVGILYWELMFLTKNFFIVSCSVFSVVVFLLKRITLSDSNYTVRSFPAFLYVLVEDPLIILVNWQIFQFVVMQVNCYHEILLTACNEIHSEFYLVNLLRYYALYVEPATQMVIGFLVNCQWGHYLVMFVHPTGQHNVV